MNVLSITSGWRSDCLFLYRDREPEGEALKIEADSEGGATTLRLIGRLQAEHVAQLKKEIEDRSVERLCLREVTLVDADVVRFLTVCAVNGILIVNCSAYIHEWMDREREQTD